MSIYNKILVVADINHDEQPALVRTIQLAKKSTSTSHITFFLSIYDFSYEMTSMLSVDERRRNAQGVIHQREIWMNKVAEPYLDDSIEFNVQVVWHNRPYGGDHCRGIQWRAWDLNQGGTRSLHYSKSVIFTYRLAPIEKVLAQSY